MLRSEEPSPLVQAAITILTRGEPLPVDMTARLMEEGVDPSQLEERYGE